MIDRRVLISVKDTNTMDSEVEMSEDSDFDINEEEEGNVTN